MNGIKRRAVFLTAFFIMVLCVCAGLLVGCKDPFTPDDPEYTVTFYAETPGIYKKLTVKQGASVGGAMRLQIQAEAATPLAAGGLC